MRGYVPETLLLLGKALVALGQVDEAEISLRDSLEMAQTLGSRWSEWQILAARSTLHPDTENGLVWRDEARTLIEKLPTILTHPNGSRVSWLVKMSGRCWLKQCSPSICQSDGIFTALLRRSCILASIAFG